MQGCTLLLVNGSHTCGRVKCFGRVDDFAAMRYDSQQAEDQTETVKQRRRTTQYVVFGQAQSIAYESAVIDKRAKAASAWFVKLKSTGGSY